MKGDNNGEGGVGKVKDYIFKRHCLVKAILSKAIIMHR